MSAKRACILWGLGLTAAILLAISAPLALAAMEDQPAAKATEKPIGGMRTATGEFKPLYWSDVEKEIQKAKVKVDKMAGEVAAAKVNPEADSVEKAFGDSLSVVHHEQDIAEIRDRFTSATATLEHMIQEKEDSKTATPEEMASMRMCLEHCKKILDTINKMHYNSSGMLTANRERYFLGAWEKHKKMMAELKTMMDECPAMVAKTMACCKAMKAEPEKTGTMGKPAETPKSMKESMGDMQKTLQKNVEKGAQKATEKGMEKMEE